MQIGVGWSGSVRSFLEAHAEDVHATLQTGMPASASQATSWEATIHHLRNALQSVGRARPEAMDWWVAFEYELPREGGRRPDVCILTSDSVVVIEVKNQREWVQPNVEQTRAYVRDLQNYHEKSQGKTVRGALWVLGDLDGHESVEGLDVIGANRLASVLLDVPGGAVPSTEASEWIASQYRPLPRLVRAARYLFDHEPMPQIRTAKSAGIPATMAVISEVVEESRRSGANHLILLTGPPGSGKTLVGLRAVYDNQKSSDVKNGVYLSGNGPLIQVLQHVLSSKEFVQDVHRFIKEYGIRKRAEVPEDFLVFDEAQRAWNADKIYEFYSKKNVADAPHASEPQLFVSAADRPNRGMTVLALIGTGQEIHSGEQSGLSLWVDALQASQKDWHVHGPSALRDLFSGHKFEESAALNLGLSLRSHSAEELHAWADAVIDGRLADAKTYAAKLQQDYFSIHITEDIDLARQFMRNRYDGEVDKTFGMICSSKARNLAKVGVDVGMYGPHQVRLNRDEAGWYASKNGQPPECLRMEKAATEFTCQGLELDGAVVLWGWDYVWDGTTWESRRTRANPLIPNPHGLRQNAYRVLLTRARDGMVIFVPPGPDMKETKAALIQAGAVPLQRGGVMTATADAANAGLC